MPFEHHLTPTLTPVDAIPMPFQCHLTPSQRHLNANPRHFQEEDAQLIKMVRPAMDAGANSLSVEALQGQHDQLDRSQATTRAMLTGLESSLLPSMDI